MKRTLCVLGSIGSLFTLPAHADDLSINTKTTTAVSTSSAANGSAGNITITSSGSVAISAAGAAVTLDSNNTISNSGTISNAVSDSGDGVNIVAGNTGSFTNIGTISLPGTTTAGVPIATTQYGVLLNGDGSFTGDIVTTSGSTISISAVGGSAGISLQSALVGDLTLGGSIKAQGSGVIGVSVASPITGAFTNKGTITTESGDKSTTTVHASPGSAVAIGASVSGGILNAGPVTGGDTTARATISTIGAGPAFLIASSAGGSAANLAVGVYSDASNPGYSLLNRGSITADGAQPGISAIGVRIGDLAGAAYGTSLAGGVYNNGTIRATATSSNSGATAAATASSDATAFIVGARAALPDIVNDGSGVISASTGGPMGGTATALSIESGAAIASLNNSGTISAEANTTSTSITSLAANAIQDAAGSLTNIKNSGVISAFATTLDSGAQTAVAANLSAGKSVVTFLDSGRVTGDILFGTAAGSQLTIEGPQASVSGRVQAAAGGSVNVAVSAGGTGGMLATPGAQLGNLTVGPGGTLQIQLSQNATSVISSTGAVSFDAQSRIVLTPVSMLSNATYTLIHTNGALTFGDFSASTANATLPFLFTGQLSEDSRNLMLQVERKNAVELGLSGVSAAIYEPAMAAALHDPQIGTALASLNSVPEVQSALLQFYPLVSNAPRDTAIAISDSTTNGVGRRQYALATTAGQSSGAWSDVSRTSLKDPTSAGYDLDGTGFSVGFDWGLGSTGHFGTAFSYSHGTPHGVSDGRQVGVEWSMGSLYAGLASDGAFVNAQFDFGFGSFRGRRNFTIGSVSHLVTTQDWSGVLSAMGFDGGYVIDLNVLRVVPQVGMDVMTLSGSRYQETGGGKGVDLAVTDRFENSGRVFAGLGVNQDYHIGDIRLIPDVRAGWTYELEKTPPDTVAAFATDPITTFSIPGLATDTSKVVVDATFEIALDNFMATIGYDTSIGAHSRMQSAKLGLLAQF